MYKVVIVDDERYVLDLFPVLVDWNEYGFEIVKILQNGSDALDYISTHPVDVVFTDIAMQPMSGLELAKILHERYPEILLIFFTAHRDFEYARQAILYEAFEYIVKPITYDALCKTLNRIISKLESKDTTIKLPVVSSKDENITTVHNFLKENYSKPISLEDVASVVSMSPVYFSSYYKKLTGVNFSVTLKEIRMQKAIELLKNPKVKTSRVHELVGYTSYSHFTKSFQSRYGVTPTEYRTSIFEQSDNGEI